MTFRQWTYFLLLTVIWGSSFLWIKIAVNVISPFQVISLRYFFALVVLFVYLLYKKAGFPKNLRQMGVLVLQGLLSSAIPWLLITWAEKFIYSAEATVINGTVPLFTMLIAHLFVHDDKMTFRRISGLLMGFLGVVILVQNSLSIGRGEGVMSSMVLPGIGAMLLASLFYGISNVYARIKMKGLTPVFQAFYSMFPAAMIVWTSTTIFDFPSRIPSSLLVWIAVIWLGVLGGGISYILFYRLLHEIGPTRVSLVTFTIPVVGVSLGVIFLKEQLSWSLVFGALLIISGLFAVNRKSGDKKLRKN